MLLACWRNDRMQKKLDYTQEEVRVLKEILATTTGRRRIRFTDRQCRRPATKGKALAPEERRSCCELVTPATILAWFCKPESTSTCAIISERGSIKGSMASSSWRHSRVPMTTTSPSLSGAAAPSACKCIFWRRRRRRARSRSWAVQINTLAIWPAWGQAQLRRGGGLHSQTKLNDGGGRVDTWLRVSDSGVVHMHGTCSV